MRIQALKKFGQNFITDQNVTNAIVRRMWSKYMEDAHKSLVIEIGPGTTFSPQRRE